MPIDVLAIKGCPNDDCHVTQFVRRAFEDACSPDGCVMEYVQSACEGDISKFSLDIYVHWCMRATMELGILTDLQARSTISKLVVDGFALGMLVGQHDAREDMKNG